MEFKIQIKGRVYVLAIGHETLWFSQIPLIMLSEEFYDHREVVYARIFWMSKNFMKKEVKWLIKAINGVRLSWIYRLIVKLVKNV